jgi:hypothetical protein
VSGIQVRGISGLVANIHAANAAVARDVRAAMQHRGKEQHADTKAEAPKRTGFLAAHTRLDFSPEGLAYSIGYDAQDWAEAGLYPYFFPVILGSSTQSANDFLTRVHEMHRERVTRDVGDAVKRGLASVRA